MACLVAYDIEDDKVRGRLARYLEKQGLRLQKSVFVVEVKKHGFKRMLGHLRKLAGKEGKIAVVRLCKGCRENALSLSEEKEGFYLF